MRLSRATVAFAFCLECVLSAPVTAADVLPAVVSTTPRYAAPGSLLANCTETAMVTEPVKRTVRKPAPRKRVVQRKRTHRKTVAARPHRPVAKKHVVKKAATPVKHKVVHKRPAKHPVRHRPRHKAVAHKAAPRPIVHRVTYASPICDSRAPVIDELLGLTGLPELPPFDGPILPGPDEDTAKAFAALLPNAPAPTSFSPQSFPFFPPVFGLPFPGGPGGGGGTPPGGGGDTPPPTVAVPEPASWAMMILGLGMAGYVLRRRRRKSRQDQQSGAL